MAVPSGTKAQALQSCAAELERNRYCEGDSQCRSLLLVFAVLLAARCTTDRLPCPARLLILFSVQIDARLIPCQEETRCVSQLLVSSTNAATVTSRVE